MRSLCNRTRLGAPVVVVLLVIGAVGCADNGGGKEATATTARTRQPTEISIAARDYAFDVPASVAGGVVELRFTNQGKEPHLAGIVKIGADTTLDDVKAFFSAPPSGPPPFEEIGGLPTADPGGTGNQTLQLDQGNYALFCPIRSPDGVPHLAKGMLTGFTVTAPAGASRLPETTARIAGRDFAFSALPALKAGENLVAFDNRGSQLHEINLVELADGKTLDDALAWVRKPEGPPPLHFLSGAAIKPGATTTTRLTLKAGATYALVCMIPDPADGVPHVVKGMASTTFKIS